MTKQKVLDKVRTLASAILEQQATEQLSPETIEQLKEIAKPDKKEIEKLKGETENEKEQPSQ